MELNASGNKPSFLKRSWIRRSADSEGVSKFGVHIQMETKE